MSKKSVWSSKHFWIYVKIALKNRTTPSRVFRLAHGYDEVHSQDRDVMHALKEEGIISRRDDEHSSSSGHHHHHHHHHHSHSSHHHHSEEK